MAESLLQNFYCELAFVSLVLMLLMQYNSHSLYNDKSLSSLSMMLGAGVLLSISEILWALFGGNPILNRFLFPCSCAIITTETLLFSFFFEFVAKELVHWPKKRWVDVLLVAFPTAIVLLTCLTVNAVQGGNADIFTNPTVLGVYLTMFIPYILAATVIAVITAVRGKKGSDERRDAADILIYVVVSQILSLSQLVMWDVNYQCFSITVSLPLCFLMSRRSTKTLVAQKSSRAAVEAELATAAGIQRSAMPDRFPPFEHHPGIDLYAELHMAKEVGGDFFDCFELDSHRVCFLVADVSGKGVPAALFMMRAKTMIKNYSGVCSDTAELCFYVNSALCENNSEEMFATAWIAILDTDTLKLQYTNAGHNYPCYAGKGEQFRMLRDRHGMFLASFPGVKYGLSEMQLSCGDSLFLYTDGLTEAQNRKEDLLGERRVLELLNGSADRDGRQVLPGLKAAVDAFADGLPQFDDITMLMVNIREKGQTADVQEKQES